jgi:hypothetical protein
MERRPVGGMVVGFSSCQAAEDSSAEEDEEEREIKEWEVEDELTDESSGEDSGSEEETKTKSKCSNREALAVLKDQGSYSEAASKILDDVAGGSMDMLGSQVEKKKKQVIRKIARNLQRLDAQKKKKMFRGKPEALDDTFENYSQSSLAKEVKEEKAKKGLEVKKSEKKYRKSLDRCKDLQTIKDRTQEMLETIVSEAAEQEVTEVQLLAFLLHRVSYQHDRDLAKKMFHLFRSGEWQPGLELVGREKMLALTERCRLGKGGFRYLHRQLKPHGLKMPYYPEVAALRRQVCPVLRPYIDMAGRVVGVTAGLRDSLQLTLRRHIQSGQADYLKTADCSLSVSVTVGFDGRGEKTMYKQKSQVGIDTSHSLSSQYMVTEVSKLANT